MNGIVAIEKETGIVKKKMPEALAGSEARESSLRQWGLELPLLKQKYRLLERLLKYDARYLKSSANRSAPDDLLRECQHFLAGPVADFEDQYNKHSDFLTCFELRSKAGADERLGRFQHLQKEWNDLQVKNQHLELKLLNALVNRYPVVII